MTTTTNSTAAPSTNDSTAPLVRFCVALETYRRTPEGRVRGERELVGHFFPHDGKAARDELFRFVPREIRGPILSGWKIRGPKTALADDDAKVLKVVHDALVAGDVDAAAVEAAFSPALLLAWVPLASWWAFWRAGALSERAIGKALAMAYDLGLLEAAWFLANLEAPVTGSLAPGVAPKRGIEVLADGLSKADLTEWMRGIHERGDGSPRGLVAALGWDRIVRQTRAPLLLAALDRWASKVGLVAPTGANEIRRSS